MLFLRARCMNSFETFSHGSSRRFLLNSSRSRVNSFSLVRNHSTCETTFGRSTSIVLLAMAILLGWRWSGFIVYGVLPAEFLDCDCRQSARRDDATGNQHCG